MCWNYPIDSDDRIHVLYIEITPPDVKRQNIIKQIYRDPNASIEVKDVKPGEGI